MLGATLSQIALGAARPSASYAGLALGADAAVIGLIAASFAVLPMLVALPIGAVAGRIARIGVVPAASSALLVAGCALGALATSIPLLLLACAVIGVANLGLLIGAQAWIARSAPVVRYNDGFGWMTAGMALGQAIGPLLSGWSIGLSASEQDGIAQSFWIAAGVGAVIVVVFASGAIRRDDDEPDARVGATEILGTPDVARYIVVSAAVLTSVDILIAYLPLLGAENGVAPVIVGTMLAVRGIASMLSRLLLGPLVRRFGQSALIVASAIGAAVCLAVVVSAPVPAVMFPALAVGGFLLGMGQPLTMSAVAVALPASARSSGLALRLLGNRIAQTATPLLAGGVSVAFGARSALLLQVVGLVASGAWEYAVRRGRENP